MPRISTDCEGLLMNFDTNPDHESIRDSVRGLMAKFPDPYWLGKDERHEYPSEFYDAFAAAGFLGVAIPEEGSPVFQLKENVTLTSNHPEYSWVNPIQVWAPGTVDVSKGEIRIKAYAC